MDDFLFELYESFEWIDRWVLIYSFFVVPSEKLRIGINVAQRIFDGCSGKKNSFQLILELVKNVINDISHHQKVMNHNSTVDVFV